MECLSILKKNEGLEKKRAKEGKKEEIMVDKSPEQMHN
jgi:hypothetical protein